MILHSEVRRGAALLAIAGLLSPGAGFTQSASTDVSRGEKVYTRACEECHGPSGRGDGPKARKLGFRPRDFSLGSFKCRCTPSGQLPTDEDLKRVVADGMPGTPMQAQEGKLSEEEIGAVVQFIKTFSQRFAAEAAPPCISLPHRNEGYGPAVSDGRQIYRILQCWKCHGKRGRGDGPASRDLKDDWGQPIKAYNFTVLKKFKCGGNERDFYRTFHTGMSGSPMPSFTSAFLFSRENIADIVAMKAAFEPKEIEELEEYSKQQPDAQAIRAMSYEVRRDFIERRSWALIDFLRSLLQR
jgi:cytochrome c oxidase cbb3-type subunit 2